MDFTVTVLSDALPGAVYAALTDILNWPRFIPGISGIEMQTEDGVRPGASFYELRRRFGLERSEDVLIRAMMPRQRLVLASGGGASLRIRRVYDVKATGHETELNLHCSAEAANWRGRLTMPFARIGQPGLEERYEEDLMAIKAEAERRSS